MATFSIKAAAKMLDLSEVYIRRMIQQGKIETIKVAVSENVWRHEISEETLNSWRKQTSARTTREDGRNKFVVYANADEFAKLQQVCKQMNLPIERANPSEVTKKRYLRNKAKRLAKKAQQA